MKETMKTQVIALMMILITLGVIEVVMIVQTNRLIEQNNKLINIEYSRCVNDMHKVGDKCSK